MYDVIRDIYKSFSKYFDKYATRTIISWKLKILYSQQKMQFQDNEYRCSVSLKAKERERSKGRLDTTEQMFFKSGERSGSKNLIKAAARRGSHHGLKFFSDLSAASYSTTSCHLCSVYTPLSLSSPRSREELRNAATPAKSTTCGCNLSDSTVAPPTASNYAR